MIVAPDQPILIHWIIRFGINAVV